jgi:putative SOS response-associated peptidase YedK
VIQISSPLRLSIVEGFNASDSPMANVRPRYNVAPNQELLVISDNHTLAARTKEITSSESRRHQTLRTSRQVGH